MMKLQLVCLYVFILSSFMACQGQDSLTISEEPAIRILFVGNSLTYTNDLPELVKQEARKSGVEVHTEMIALPNYALEDHWQDGSMQKRISSGAFDFVIVQQGPSSQSDGREMLLDFGTRIKKLCDEHNSKLAFFMVWPARVNWHTFPGVIKNYTDAATATQSILCPVGLTWKQFMESSGDYSYYSPDQFHPSMKGSQVAAVLIFQAVRENPRKVRNK